MEHGGSGYGGHVTLLLRFLRRASANDGRAATLTWKLVSTASGLATGLIVRRLLNLAWARFAPSGHRPPLSPGDEQVGWREAVAWSAAAGAGVGVARVVSDRLAASGWELATGQPPPGVGAR